MGVHGVEKKKMPTQPGEPFQIGSSGYTGQWTGQGWAVWQGEPAGPAIIVWPPPQPPIDEGSFIIWFLGKLANLGPILSQWPLPPN
jgi:hypothetical protein